MVSVITGDIINSSGLEKSVRKVVYQKLEQFIFELERGDFNLKGETNHGDWFQCLLSKPVYSLRIALLIKAYLRSLPLNQFQPSIKFAKNKMKNDGPLDVRISIGLGDIDFISSRVGASDGSAFRISGRLLEKIKKQSQTLQAQVEGKEELNEQLHTLFVMLDFILSKTTALQCEVILRKLQGKKEIEIANELGVLQSAVNQRSTAAGWNVIETALNHFEKTISTIQ